MATKYGIFDARRWTNDESVGQTVNTSTPYVPPAPVAEVAMLERPVEIVEAPPKPVYVPTKYEKVSVSISAYTPEQLSEYSEVAAVVGVAPADLQVEEFKSFLLASGITVFDLTTVVAFMDQKSKDEGQGWGWYWQPLRAKDAGEMWFGTAAVREEWGNIYSSGGGISSRRLRDNSPASDHYQTNHPVYGKIVPLHALKKVAQIEKDFKHPVKFMVSDYAPAPAFRADPFLMAVIPNSNLRGGVGRYVIDVWDEPGFGIEHMLKSGV